MGAKGEEGGVRREGGGPGCMRRYTFPFCDSQYVNPRARMLGGERGRWGGRE